jgi:hypothetical protein
MIVPRTRLWLSYEESDVVYSIDDG